MRKELRRELRKIEMQIYSYSSERFVTNLGDGDSLRFNLSSKSRTKKTIFKIDIAKAKRNLKVLKKGGQIQEFCFGPGLQELRLQGLA